MVPLPGFTSIRKAYAVVCLPAAIHTATLVPLCILLFRGTTVWAFPGKAWSTMHMSRNKHPCHYRLSHRKPRSPPQSLDSEFPTQESPLPGSFKMALDTARFAVPGVRLQNSRRHHIGTTSVFASGRRQYRFWTHDVFSCKHAFYAPSGTRKEPNSPDVTSGVSKGYWKVLRDTRLQHSVPTVWVRPRHS